MLRFKDFIVESRLLNSIVKDLKITDNLNNFASFNTIYNHYLTKLHTIAKMLRKAEKTNKLDIHTNLKNNIDLLCYSMMAYKIRLKRKESITMFSDLISEYKKCSDILDYAIKDWPIAN